MAVKQIKGEDDYAESNDSGDSEDQKPRKFIDASSKFGVKALKTKKTVETGKELDADHVLRAARNITGNADSDKDSDEESDDMCRPTIKFAPKKEVVKESKKKSKVVVHTAVEFGEDDLQNFNAEKNKLIKEEMTEDSKQQ